MDQQKQKMPARMLKNDFSILQYDGTKGVIEVSMRDKTFKNFEFSPVNGIDMYAFVDNTNPTKPIKRVFYWFM